MAEPIPGPTTERFAALAAQLDVTILLGMAERQDGKVFNATAVIDRSGQLRGVMRKVHLNKHETGRGWTNGSDFPVWRFQTDSGQFNGGIMICYDREVPESARILMLNGADIIFNPMCTSCPKEDIHRCLLRTRAFENEVYIFVVNHAAPRSVGHSMTFDYNGDMMVDMSENEGVFVRTFDLDALERFRRQEGIYGKHHRRPELYQILIDPSGQIHPANAALPAAEKPDCAPQRTQRSQCGPRPQPKE